MITHKIRELLVCPKCKGGFQNKDGMFWCSKCQLQYPVIEDIPVFICQNAKEEEMSGFWNEGWKKRMGQKGDSSFYLTETPEKLRIRIDNDIINYKKSKHLLSEVLNDTDKLLLNIGCGCGEAAYFTCVGFNDYIGLDFSFNAAKYSYETIVKLGGHGITLQADAASLPIANESIELVYSNGVLHHTPETQKAFDEIYRVLKPGGKAIIGLYATYSPTFILERIYGSYYRFISFIRNRNRNVRHWYNISETAWRTESYPMNPWTKTYSKKELQKMLSKYNVSNLTIRKTGFDWSNGTLGLLKCLDSMEIGKWLAVCLSPLLGHMWKIIFRKK